MARILASGRRALAAERSVAHAGDSAGAVGAAAMGYRARIRAAAVAPTVPGFIVSLSGLSVLPLCPAFPLRARRLAGLFIARCACAVRR